MSMKPCPFCGSMSQTVKTVWKTWRFVACKCKAAGAPAKDDEGAIANWNTRAVTITEYATDKIADLQAENEKLRELVAKARDPQRIGGTADPESFVYAIEQLREFRWQHATNDEEAIPYINNVADAHERENAELRRELELEMFRGAGEIESYKREASVAAKHAAQAKSENEKLRELVAYMWPHVRHRSRMCSECELPCDESDECLLYEPMRDCMSKLGIEVEQ